MREKGVFIYGDDFLENISYKTGVDRKVASQIKAFNDAGFYCRQICFPKEKWTWWYSIKVRLPFCNVCPKWEYMRDFEDVDFIYFRRSAAITVYALKVLRLIKKNNPNVKILLEIPTYPYDKELSQKIRNYPLLWKDCYNRRKLKKYVDKIVTVSDDNIIFNIPTIKMVNGIDVNQISPIIPQEDTKTIHIIGVAMLTIWHGYDRLIKGIGEYYRNKGHRNIIFHVVGAGEESIISSYKDIIDKYRIEKHVILHGYQTGDSLDELYNRCRIAVISLATHRKGIHKLSTLKSREYLAKGLPVVSSGLTDVFERESFRYNLAIPSDESPVKVEKLIRFYDSIYGEMSQEKVISEIRDFAKQKIEIHKTMLPVFNYLLNN